MATEKGKLPISEIFLKSDFEALIQLVRQKGFQPNDFSRTASPLGVHYGWQLTHNATNVGFSLKRASDTPLRWEAHTTMRHVHTSKVTNFGAVVPTYANLWDFFGSWLAQLSDFIAQEARENAIPDEWEDLFTPLPEDAPIVRTPEYQLTSYDVSVIREGIFSALEDIKARQLLAASQLGSV